MRNAIRRWLRRCRAAGCPGRQRCQSEGSWGVLCPDRDIALPWLREWGVPSGRAAGDDQAHRDWYHRTMTHPPRPRPAAQLTVTARCETIIGAVLRFYDLAEAKAAAAIPGYSWDSTERIMT